MRIPQETILAIEEAIQVEEVLGDFHSLQKKGKKYLCPFHQDKHPSFSITSDGKFYKCFSCQAKGSAVSYLMEQQGMRYPQAMQYLAEKYRIPWQVDEESEEKIAHEKEKESLYILLAKVKAYYVGNLHKGVLQPAYDYLQKRDLADPDLLSKFGIGYSFPEWRALYDFATAQGYDDELLKQAGLILKKEGEERAYDRFRGRLIFPIYNVIGKVIGFGGRDLAGAAKHTPKYINSPETPVYQKSLILYGLYQAKQAIKAKDNCYLVEGYTDVLALHQAGIEHVVASGGTALTQEQVALLTRFTRHITLLFDGDAAGQEAALRGIDLLLAQGCDVKIVCLPPKEDPDSLRRSQGNEALHAYLQEHIQDFIVFKANILFEAAGDDPAKRAEAMTQLLATIAAIPDTLKRTFYIQSCSQSLGLHEAILQEKLTELLQKKKREQRPRLVQKKQRPKAVTDLSPTSHAERTVLYMLLHYADYTIESDIRLADYLFKELGHIVFSTLTYQAIWDQFKAQWYTSGPISGEVFLASQGRELEESARKLMQKKKKLSDKWETTYHIIIPREEDGLATHAVKNVQRLKVAHLTEAIKKNMAQLQQATTQEEEEKYLLEFLNLKKDQEKLAKDLSTVVLHH